MITIGMAELSLIAGIAGIIIFYAICAGIGFILSIGLNKISKPKDPLMGSRPQKAINRKKFLFYGHFLPLIIYLAINWVVVYIIPTSRSSLIYYSMFILLFISLLCYIPAARCRSLDCGKSWSWVILSIIPFLGV